MPCSSSAASRGPPQQLGLSQPALSASLARLRRHFGDELLARVGERVPAHPAGGPAQAPRPAGADGVERVFTSQPDFDPGESTREFSVLLSDYAAALLGDAIAGLLAEEAPGPGCD